jgi:glycosyltransferase involved in cell wall biosynthesis
MRIVFDHQMFCLQQYGGISRYFYELASRIADGHHVEICAPFYINEYFRPGGLMPRGFKVAPLARSARLATTVNAIAAWVLLKRRRDVDIFHETYFSLADCAPARPTKRVITVYDMIHEKFAASFRPDDPVRAQKAHAVRRADHVICISENTRRDLVELLQVPIERTSVVYLGQSLMLQQTRPGVAPREPYILYVGQRTSYKNWTGLLEAVASSAILRNDFTVVCFGGGRFTANEQQLIESLRLRVRHVGGGDEVLATLYRAAAAFAYPSLYEGFGIPPLEAMALDCPVVCANAASLPEVVGDSAELFDPTDIEDMRHALERVLTSRDHREALVRKGATRSQQFSWQKCADDTLRVYEAVRTQ